MALVLPNAGPVTVDDLADTPDDGRRYELIDGTLIVTPSPDTRHQILVTRLGALLDAALPVDLTVLVAPYDWVLTPTTKFQPDVVVARTNALGPERLEQTPVLVVEVLSPSTRRTDLGTKRLAYQEAGVPAYWVVDPADPVTLTVLQLNANSEYEAAATVSGDESHTDPVLGLTVTPARLLHR